MSIINYRSDFWCWNFNLL